MKVAIAIATMAAGSRVRLPVISDTIMITARGECAMAPKHAVIPMMTNGAGLSGATPASSNSRQIPAPAAPPTTIPGPKTPAEPPDPMVRLVARILTKGRASTAHSAMSSRSARLSVSCSTPYPVPSTPGTSRPSAPTARPASAGRAIRGSGVRWKKFVSP